MPDLRASHIRRIAELRSRGADMSDKMHKKEDEKRMVEATFKMYHPETDAEREMNLLWIRRRQEDDMKRKKDEEVQQAVQKWAMDRSRDESENLRKRESTKLAAGLGHILQEGVDQEKPFARQSSSYHLHVDLAGKAALANQSTAKEAASSNRHQGQENVDVVRWRYALPESTAAKLRASWTTRSVVGA
ncbi:uncharacterized protein PITG_06801 [Phytophthora infestans T30-4]|uniref:Uncharacterized protein n=1 Tax=Phytophthora infestans (strain T30-4) TaxID=403677 RepID=D0N853_PHYIT|nr:uncharacterized protein PITG_06801 [Phytophthora infestans T30-4]EEY53170.1 conserved hypothetical protein [Phytophthora infestans T30-4]|eukprot:XP_002904788.1 conserved hypothetical protein [Phytophthora infestans T30-4]